MIYLLEDDDSIRDFVIYTLNSQGMEARGFGLPSEFWNAMADQVPSLVLLDVMLPEEDGLSVLKKLRSAARTAKLPIIMLTAKGTEYDKVLGLDGGADDYVTKPFRPQILGAKVKALIRRSKSFSQENNQQISCGPFLCDTTTMRFYKSNVELNLSEKERSLLLLFVRHPQQVFTKDMIYEQIWGNLIAVDDNAIMVYINRLRSKIEDNARTPQHIITIRGVGYRFVP